MSLIALYQSPLTHSQHSSILFFNQRTCNSVLTLYLHYSSLHFPYSSYTLQRFASRLQLWVFQANFASLQ